ncbi:hypothetical protein QTP88_010384 [Uroleucon formosanum]
MASEDSDHDGIVSSGECLSSDDECFTVDDIMNAVKNSTDCVVYDEAGVLKNVNDLCNYVINNEGYVDNPNHLEDNDVNMLNLTNIISNNDTLSLENCNVINSSSFDADDSVVHDNINSNDLSISNICTDHTQTPEVFNNLSETEPKQRKNIAEPKGWDRNKSKTLRMKGCAYLGYRRENPKNTNKILHDVMRESRKMGATCNSPTCKRWKNRCCNTISEDERGKIFNELWKEMNWDSKKMFVCSTVEIMATKQKTVEGGNSRRGSSFFYFLRINGKKIPVCQSMYLNTLGLNKSEVRYWIQNFKNTNLPTIKCNEFIEENENDNDNYAREKDRSLVRKPLQKIVTLQNFFDSLPTLPSHYCRKTSKKLFLQTDIKSWTQLYKLYTENCKKNSEAPVSRHTFDREKKERNIDIYIPKKDRCDTCISFENHHITNESYEKHLKRKESARNEKQKDKDAAKQKICHTVCCDLMAVQCVPNIRASSAYYKLKLTAHNFTVYNLATHDAMVYWFDESECSMSASIFASCLVDYLSELLDQSLKTIIVFSDGCGYQNRNSILSNALLHLSVVRKVTIIQKYLEKGHTQMECDSAHSTIERNYRNIDVYLPSQYSIHTIAARKFPMPYRSRLLDHTFFKDFSNEKMMVYKSIRPGHLPGDPTVNELRWIQYEPTGLIYYKINFEDDLQLLPTRPKNVTQYNSFPNLYQSRPKIPKDKWTDLQSLKAFMPSDTHAFYDSLICEDESQRTLKRQQAAEKKNETQKRTNEVTKKRKTQ